MYTKQQKIDAICEARGIVGTNEEKIAFLKELEPEIDAELQKYRDELIASIAHSQAMLANISDTAKEELNRRATILLINKEKELEVATALETKVEL